MPSPYNPFFRIFFSIPVLFLFIIWALIRIGDKKFTIFVLLTALAICFLTFQKCKESESWIKTLGVISVNTPDELGASYVIKRKKYYTNYPTALDIYAKTLHIKLPTKPNYYTDSNGIAQPPINSIVPVYYDPTNPNQAVFEKGIPSILIMTFICFGLVFFWESIWLITGNIPAKDTSPYSTFNRGS